jgi:hypothetical protein
VVGVSARPLNLTPRQAAALDRLLDAYLATESDAEPIVPILRGVKVKLERIPMDHAGLDGGRS